MTPIAALSQLAGRHLRAVRPLNLSAPERCWITHAEIAAGGVLAFELGPHPNKQWGTGGIPQAN